MGHYLSEMESPAEAKAREDERRAMRSWQERGYRYVSFDVMADTPLVHEPCGTVVGYRYTEVHDRFCPAKEA
jgi:hypothetical protein